MTDEEKLQAKTCFVAEAMTRHCAAAIVEFDRLSFENQEHWGREPVDSELDSGIKNLERTLSYTVNDRVFLSLRSRGEFIFSFKAMLLALPFCEKEFESLTDQQQFRWYLESVKEKPEEAGLKAVKHNPTVH